MKSAFRNFTAMCLVLFFVLPRAGQAAAGIPLVAECELDPGNKMALTGTDGVDASSSMYQDLVAQISRLEVQIWGVNSDPYKVLMTKTVSGKQGITAPVSETAIGRSVSYETGRGSGALDIVFFLSTVAGANSRYRGVLLVDWLDRKAGVKTGGPIYFGFDCNWSTPPVNRN